LWDYEALSFYRGSGLAVESGLPGGVTFFFPPLAGGFEFAVAGGEDFLLPTFELVLGRDIAEGGVQADRVVVFDKPDDDPSRVVHGQGRPWADALFLEDAVPAFDLTVTLGVVRRRSGVGHAADADELLEVAGDELGAIVGDDPRRDARELLTGALDDLLDVGLGHGFTDLPVNGKAATTIQEATQVIERASDVQV